MLTFRETGEQMVEFFTQQLDEIEQLRAELEQGERELAGEWRKFHEAQHELAESRAELEKSQREFGLFGDPQAHAAAMEDLRAQVAALEKQRDTMERELSDDRGQINHLADAARELADLRAAQLEGKGVSEQEAAGLRQDLARLDKERAVLEVELETVRRRLAEMADAATAEKARMAEERAKWMDEIKQWRPMLERLANAVPPPGAAPAPPPAATANDGDPMLESIMSQFDLLQKEIARRRSGGKKVVR
jgi:chromosome segregation ATPase